MERIKTIIVDDEELAVEKIRRELLRDTDIYIVGEYYDGIYAVEGIKRHRPDLLFLDAQMPEMDGFGVLSALDGVALPVVVFVTAYDQYAVRAFEFHAVDYLLKPFDRERFSTALNRAKETVRQMAQNESLELQLKQLMESITQKNIFLERFIIKTKGRIFFLKTSEIDWIEAAGNYVKLHVGNESHLLRTTMNSIEERLDPKYFMRIHRSTIVQIDRIKEIHPLFSGEYLIVIKNLTKLTLSRSYRSRLKGLT